MKNALISVSDKTGIIQLAKFLTDNNHRILSTGGTYKYLKNHVPAGQIEQISNFTGFPEILGGRVKTIHPKIHGGILARRNNKNDMKELSENNIHKIDAVITNLYPFSKEHSLDKAIELIDIGGHTLIRAAAKNFNDVLVITKPDDYDWIMENYDHITPENRRELATKAFKHIAEYDAMIYEYFSPGIHTRFYRKEFSLKYGSNPHQSEAGLYGFGGGSHPTSMAKADFPLKILNGKPGYINMLDGLYGWQLVSDLRKATGRSAATSYKHNSPAGAAISQPLSAVLSKVYDVENRKLSNLAQAYIRARNADPLSSFGDFIALSDKVDVCTAKLIKREVSDGIIAPGYDAEAFKILSSKKGGKYVVIEVDPNYCFEGNLEFREMMGIGLAQTPDRRQFTKESLKNVVTKDKLNLSENDELNLLVANICLKYTQSNSVAFAADGQVIGVGAGQQNRVDCVKLARRKAEMWFLRQHPKVLNLFQLFNSKVRRQAKVNAIIQYIQGFNTTTERDNWKKVFKTVPPELTILEKSKFLKELDGVALASDAFFPFRDSIDVVEGCGIKVVSQPGGSIADKSVIEACNKYGIKMCFTEHRLFCH